MIERPAALELNKGFFLRFTQQRPWVRVKVAASLDGRTAMASGESQWITGAEARADVQYWRARSCAIVTGIGTVLADDPQLTVRDSAYAVDGVIRQPLRVVADSTLRTPPTARVLQTPGHVLIATVAGHAKPGARRCGRRSVRNGRSAGRILRRCSRALAARGVNEVLVEAGATLTGEVLRLGLWDEAIVYLAPKLLGRDARPFAELSVDRLADAIDGTIADVRLVGDDLRVQILRNAA